MICFKTQKYPIVSLRTIHMRAVCFMCFLSAALMLSGCASLKQQKRDTQQQVSTLSEFDGIYMNPSSTNDDAEFSSLWNQLILADKIDTLDFKKATIALRAVGNSKIKATWLENGIEKKSIELQGKLKDNYFVSRHKRSVIPIPLIYGQIKKNQFQVWLDKNNQLQVDRLQKRWGWVFLFIAGKDETRNYHYKKLKE